MNCNQGMYAKPLSFSDERPPLRFLKLTLPVFTNLLGERRQIKNHPGSPCSEISERCIGLLCEGVTRYSSSRFLECSLSGPGSRASAIPYGDLFLPTVPPLAGTLLEYNIPNEAAQGHYDIGHFVFNHFPKSPQPFSLLLNTVLTL